MTCDGWSESAIHSHVRRLRRLVKKGWSDSISRQGSFRVRFAMQDLVD